MSGFINALGNKGSHDARTENGALAHSSVGNSFLDDFSQAGTYRERSMDSVRTTMNILWKSNPLLALQSTFYYRMVTRKVKFKGTSTEKVQKGAGLKDEFLKRYLCIHELDREVFYKNLWLVPVVGSWRDIWQLMWYAQQFHIDIDKKKFFDMMTLAHTDDLFLKYLPLEKAASKLKSPRSKALTKFSREYRDYLGISARDMRKLKSQGKGHIWQQLISKKNFKDIEWNHIPGRALAILVNGPFLDNQGLKKSYEAWIAKQPVAKFTGYPHELFKMLRSGNSWSTRMITNNTVLMTVDKQFQGLIDLAKKDQGGFQENVWCALDTSGSMTSPAMKDGTTPFDACVGLGIYFSALNEGAFKDNVIMFDSTSRVMQLRGTASQKYKQITESSTAWGSTNFQSVINEIVRVRRANPGIPIEDYPSVLLVVSDMQFNPTRGNAISNYEDAMQKLEAVGLPRISIVWWQVRAGGVSNVPSTIADPGTYYFSGYDGSIITLLLGGETIEDENGNKVRPTAMEAMMMAFQQEILLEATL